MKKSSFFLHLIAILIVSSVFSCDKETLQPQNNGVYQVGAAFFGEKTEISDFSKYERKLVEVNEPFDLEIHFIPFSDDTLVENIKVELLDLEGNLLETLASKSVNESGTYKLPLSFTPSALGDFIIRAVSTNAFGEEGRSRELPVKCQHKVGENLKVLIDIYKPLQGQTFSLGDRVPMEYHLTKREGLGNEYRVSVIRFTSSVRFTVEMSKTVSLGDFNFEQFSFFPEQRGDYQLIVMTVGTRAERNMMYVDFKVR